jgi:hypothetical protein
VTGGDEIATPQQPSRDSLEPREKKHKSAQRYFAVPDELVD